MMPPGPLGADRDRGRPRGFGSLLYNPSVLVTIQVVFVQLFTTGVFFVLAPLVGPRAFGLLALVMVFVGFCETVLTGVTVEALLSIVDIDELHYSTATAAAAAAAIVLGLLMLLLSGAAAGLAGDPELSSVMRWMSALPLLSAFAAAPTARTKRDLNFRATVTRALFSVTVSGVAGIALAVAGAGVWALVAQAIAGRAIAALTLWAVVPLRFRLAVSRDRLRELSRISATLFAARIMAWASGQVPRLILGVWLGTVDLGLYSLGTRLTDIVVKLSIEPRTVIARIELRRFAASEELVEHFRKLLIATSALCFPLCVGGFVLAPVLVRAWLGTKWLGGIGCVRLLLLTCIPYVTYYCATATFLATGNRKAEMVIASVQLAAVAVFLLAFASFGLDAAAASVLLALSSTLVIPVILLWKRCGISTSVVLAAQLPALVSSTVMGTCVWALEPALLASFHPRVATLILGAAGALAYSMAMLIFAPGFVKERSQGVALFFSKAG